MSTLRLLPVPARNSVRHGGRPCTTAVDNRSSEHSTFSRELLFAEFAPLVRRLIRQYGRDAEMRQDLEGEIYCRFCALLDVYDPERGIPLRPYLVRQLSAGIYTYARQQWRHKKRETTWETPDGFREPQGAIDPTPAWVSALSQQMVVTSLKEAMLKLSARQRKVILWRYYQDRSFEEIAQTLGIQTATVRSLLRHGLNNLRKQMGSETWAVFEE